MPPFSCIMGFCDVETALLHTGYSLTWTCKRLWISNSIFLRVVVTNSPQLIEVRDLNGCHAIKQNFERCHTWSQLKAQRSLLLNSTFSTTSWNYIFSEQDGFGVVNGCAGWCLEKIKSSKVCFHKCKSILPKIQSIEYRFCFICCSPRVVLQNVSC